MHRLPNIHFKTLGGLQVWTDFRWRIGFRLQQHATTGHWRLLDQDNVRRAWGTKQHCLEKLEHARPKNPNSGRHYILLAHGLMRTSRSMLPLERYLTTKEFDHVIRFSYASSRKSIDDHASALQELLADLPADCRISFVGHSMGNIVVRRMLGELTDNDPHGLLVRCNAMVMLGPPNQGAAIARRLAPTGLYGIVTGKGGLQLGPEWSAFASRLATPPFPFAIVAGDVSNRRIQNPLLGSENDYLVTVDEAKLVGCESFHTVKVMHTLLMTDPHVLRIAADFIKEHQR